LDEKDNDQDDGQGEVGWRRWVAQRPPCDEDKDAANEKDSSKSLEKVAEPILKAMGLWRGRYVLAKLSSSPLDLVVRQALAEGG
jgi:hypothetical protein